MDFTLKTYKSLLKALLNQNYTFKTFEQFIRDDSSDEKTIILRHDVDRLPKNALKMANIEKELGVRGSYYFRVVKQSFDADIIREIAAMGHEIGYHYENLVAVSHQHSAFSKKKIEEKRKETGVRSKEDGSGIWGLGFGKNKKELGDRSKEEEVKSKKEKESLSTQNSKLKTQNSIFELAIEDFKRNLERLRKLFPIKTICMHGSPLSKYDSRDLWKVYDYRDFGIIGEPYFDVDFNEVLYLTDTGRRWDGERFNVRDKISYQPSAFSIQQTKGVGIWGLGFGKKKADNQMLNDKPGKFLNDSERSERMTRLGVPFLHSTFDIIRAAEQGLLPDKIMMNVHPQRWTNNPVLWVKELVWQNVKNVIKRMLVKSRNVEKSKS